MSKQFIFAISFIAFFAFGVYDSFIKQVDVFSDYTPLIQSYGVYSDRVQICIFPARQPNAPSYTIEGGGWSFTLKENAPRTGPFFMQCFGRFADTTDNIVLKRNGVVIYSIPVKEKDKTFKFDFPPSKLDDRKAISNADRWVFDSVEQPWASDLTRLFSEYVITQPAPHTAP